MLLINKYTVYVCVSLPLSEVFWLNEMILCAPVLFVLGIEYNPCNYNTRCFLYAADFSFLPLLVKVKYVL